MNRMPSRRTFVLLVCVFLAVFFAIIFALSRTEESNFELSISPINSTISYDDKTKKVSKTARFNLPVGKTSITVSAKNFTTRIIEVTIEEGKPFTQYGVLLSPENEAGKKLLAKKNEAEWRDFVGQLEAINASNDLVKENPLFAYLPYQAGDYRIDYSVSSVEGALKYTVWITSSNDTAKQSALEWIKAVDSVQTYDIQYRTFADVPASAQASESWTPSGKDTSDPAIVEGEILN